MARIFITGSADGLGLMAAQLLIKQGHKVVVHGRNQARADTALKSAAGAEAAVTGALSSIQETVRLAEHVNGLGAFDTVIHNAGVSYQEPYIKTVDGCLCGQHTRALYPHCTYHPAEAAGLFKLRTA